jgi:hypothetical protein
MHEVRGLFCALAVGVSLTGCASSTLNARLPKAGTSNAERSTLNVEVKRLEVKLPTLRVTAGDRLLVGDCTLPVEAMSHVTANTL